MIPFVSLVFFARAATADEVHAALRCSQESGLNTNVAAWTATVAGAPPMAVVEQRVEFRGHPGVFKMFDHDFDGDIDSGFFQRDDHIDDRHTPDLSSLDSLLSRRVWQRWFDAALHRINRYCT